MNQRFIAGGLLILGGIIVSGGGSEKANEPAWSSVYCRDGFVGARFTLARR
jgi:hypothetical protein